MLICLGGLPGSGKRALARELAERHGLYQYDTRSKSLQLAAPGHKRGYVQTDAIRMLFFKRVLYELPILSKMYPDMIVQNFFHRTGPRNFFLQEAAKYFDSVVFVWIESDPKELEERMRSFVSQGAARDLDEAAQKRSQVANEQEPLPKGTPVFINSFDASAPDRLWQLIKES